MTVLVSVTAEDGTIYLGADRRLTADQDVQDGFNKIIVQEHGLVAISGAASYVDKLMDIPLPDPLDYNGDPSNIRHFLYQTYIKEIKRTKVINPDMGISLIIVWAGTAWTAFGTECNLIKCRPTEAGGSGWHLALGAMFERPLNKQTALIGMRAAGHYLTSVGKEFDLYTVTRAGEVTYESLS